MTFETSMLIPMHHATEKLPPSERRYLHNTPNISRPFSWNFTSLQMLSPREEDDDDSHLCIKCSETIIGLDNYITHRKSRCGKSKAPTTKPDLPTIDPLEPTYSLGADVFFQSLELQSSVKKTSLSRLTPPIPITKASIERKDALVVASTSGDIPRISPLESNLRGEDWIGGHSLRISSNEDNQTKLINAVASISGAAKKETSTSYSIGYDYKAEDVSEESDDSDEEDDEEHVNGGKWKPPPNYTGGKWRPASPDNEDWDIRDEQEHTSGTWKTLLPDVNERDEDYDAPPPGHTKGKWVPGANDKTQIMQTTIQTKGSVQYWCGPCNRRLGSRAIYEKHLRSGLHIKKVLPEHELEFSGHLEPMKVADKRTTRPSRFVNDGIYSQVQRKRQKRSDVKLNVKIDVKKRKRKSNFIHCAGCKSRVREHLMGKHLISHYHFRKATDVSSSIYQQLILDNIEAIVHQSPFQCSPCKFYANWLSNFMQHWFSEEHEQVTSSFKGEFWCSFCKFNCETSMEMLQHMSGSEHSEVVAVINRSMPIIMRKKSMLKCKTCDKNFRFNIEIRKHCLKNGHELADTATDNYQELHKCGHCGAKFKSSLTLAAHLKSRHKQKAYVCLVCEISFKYSDEAKRHRQTSEHRIKRKEKLKEQGLLTEDITKKCPYCIDDVVLGNVLLLKDHIRNVHPDIRKTCPKCSMEFILPQEVTRHVKMNACKFQDANLEYSKWNCSQCLFKTDSQAECFFHEVLHTSPKIEVRKVGNVEKITKVYDCPLCPKSFRKPSLRHHLRQHTFERPFVCSICRANFTRCTTLSNHLKREHGSSSTESAKLLQSPPTEEDWDCEKCMKRFSNKTALSRHTISCSATGDRICDYEDCTYVASSAIQLRKHKTLHGVRKSHECEFCSFKSNQRSHLKKHMLCHKGDKPYACPHCQFTCRSLENLRKHVLRSGRHENVFLYMCHHCSYKTNMATELRAHLSTTHADTYNKKTALESVTVHLMRNL